MHLRTATQADERFLVRMAATFSRGPDSAAIQGWMDNLDFGLIAEDAYPVGAAWWRRFRMTDA